MGMGDAAVATTTDVYAPYWNPGALGKVEQKEIGAFHAMLWEETSFSFLSYVQPSLKGTLGASFIRLYSGGAEKRDINNVKQGSFADQQMALAAAYGMQVYEKLYWGFGGKYVNASIDTYSRNNLTFDSGLYYQANDRLSLGMNLQNIIAATMGDTDDKLPVTVRVGSGYEILDDNKLLLAVDMGRKFNDGKASDFYCLGLESRISKLLSLRLGRNKEELTAGFGLGLHPYALDYAMAVHDLGPSHRVSFNYKFGMTIAEIRKKLEKPAVVEIAEIAEPVRKEDSAEEVARKEKLQEKFREAYRSAIDLYKRGMYTQSLDKFTLAQKLDPTDPDIPIYIERLNLIVPIVPQNITAGKTSELLRRGITYFIEGNGDGSVKTVAYALSTEPDNFTIARLLTRVEEKTGIKAEYTKPASGMSVVDLKLYESLIAFRQKDYAKVIDLCEEVLVLEPRNDMAFKRLGSAFFALGEKAKAVMSWKRALEIKPDATLRRLISETEAEMKGSKAASPQIPPQQ